MVVNPLHDKLPRLVLVACCTCNCFKSAWIRNQWEVINKLWERDFLAAVGPIVGHASNGESRRTQLILAYFNNIEGIRLHIGWAW